MQVKFVDVSAKFISLDFLVRGPDKNIICLSLSCAFFSSYISIISSVDLDMTSTKI